MPTQTKRKRRAPAKVVREEPAPEVIEEAQLEPIPEVPPEPEPDDLIRRMYLIKKSGIELLEGPEAAISIKALREELDGDDDTDFTFYEGGRPVYIAVQNGLHPTLPLSDEALPEVETAKAYGHYSPLQFPEPGPKISEGQSGYTSMELYGWAVTLPLTISKIIELETEPKPSLLDQAKKVMTPTIVIVAAIVAVFLIVVLMQG